MSQKFEALSQRTSLALTNMRGMAALIVMLAHLEVFGRYIPWVMKYIPLDPVAIFFFISGLLIPMSLEKYGVKAFIQHRFFRLFPVLVTWSIVHFALDGLNGFSLQEFKSFLATSSLSFDMLSLTPQTVVYWTLAVEVHMYVLVALLYAYNPKQPMMRIVYGVSSLLLLAYAVACLTGHELFISLTSRNLSCILLIFMGTALLEKEKKWLHSGVLALLYAFSVLCCTQKGFLSAIDLRSIYFLVDVKDYATLTGWSTKTYGGMLVRVVSFLFFLCGLRFFTVEHEILRFFANISYPLYLSHLTIGGLIGTSSGLGILASCVVSVLFAWMIHKFVELPWMQKAKQYTQAYAQKHLTRKGSAQPSVRSV
ncbi:MAG: acyltransferase family protein [Vampirovibrionales bacterium]